MKRLFTVALITAMLSFTGIANASDVAISHARTEFDDYGNRSFAWVVIKDKVYFCEYSFVEEEYRHCNLMDMKD
jgi:hypothetical protein